MELEAATTIPTETLVGVTSSVAAGAAPVPPSRSRDTLDGSLIRGIAWTGSVKWGTQVVTWGSTLVVARVLSPEDYGLVGMATIFLGLVTLLSEFGIGTAVVALRDLSGEQVSQLNSFSVMFGLASMVLTWLAAVPMSRFFGADELVGVMLALSFTFVISSLRTVPFALLQKGLRFRSLALLDGGQAVLLALTTLTLALLGFGYWTLVLSALLSSLLSTTIVLLGHAQPFAWPRLHALRAAMTFSGHIVATRFSWYAYSNADFFVVGRFVGQAALGVYGLAWTLANVPIEKVTALLGRVTPAVFAAVQDDRAELRRYFLTLTEGIAVFTFPLTIGMALAAHDFVTLALGPKWEAATLPLQLLALYASFRSLTPLLPQILSVTGDSAYAMRNAVLSVLVLPAAFIVGSRWGTAGVAAAWIIVYPFLAVRLYRRVFARLELPATHYLKALEPGATGTILMAGAVLLVGFLAPESLPLAGVLGLKIAVGGAVYLVSVVRVHADRVAAFREVIASARR